ncbi:hypothetical protein P153DRAFT_46220 [Dothidotthia symphoricarpi CBS 119687]|uniref:Uncharacterized protein n=1 Tax=Dothidotthia symphoricarpi CBS 119687 TaxID=1392245 RepID=A0A6A6A8V4_9PLEO|nr:uncharacterized protein P153DRAFT_46220 [Dothidotthia symphoricarpi CBS 119687]KAF2127986.1 hypothetical protein P153DRAFT_46220 [Dothidotthia symphoricarpi CBS 119687]
MGLFYMLGIPHGAGAGTGTGTGTDNDYQKSVDVVEDMTLSGLEKLCLIQSLYRDPTCTLWAIDVEFTTVKYADPVPYTLTIRDARSKAVVICTNIDHDSILLTDLEDRIREHWADAAGFNEASFVIPHFAKALPARTYYADDRTDGISLNAVGDMMRAAGWDSNTHKIIC